MSIGDNQIAKTIAMPASKFMKNCWGECTLR